MKLAIISDVHGNYPALKKVLERIDSLEVDKIISLGDVTGYYAQPNKCINLLREKNAHQLLGNHDMYLINGEGCPRSRLISELLIHQQKDVSKDNISYLKTLKPILNKDSTSFVHGGWNDNLDEYMFKITYEKLVGEHDFYFSGHTHVQIKSTIKDKTYCNPGSVGQPRDGDPRAAFCTFIDNQITLYREEYDIDATILEMKSAGYTNSNLWDNLKQGSQIGGRIDKNKIKILK